MSEPVKVELGAGKRKMAGWIGIDISDAADIQCDLSRSPLPFPDESVDEIYSSHFLEHFSHQQLVAHVLPECLRILKAGGVFRAAVPDASIYIAAYIKGEPFPEVIPVYKKAYFFDAPLDSLNYIAYMAGEHKHMFDKDNLLALLRNNGFADVALRKFDPAIDIEKRRPQSLYCIASKKS